MKASILIAISLFSVTTFAAEVKQTPDMLPKQSDAWFSDATLEPYGTVSWTGVDGRARLGAGANVVAHITKGFSLWGFGESDNTQHSTIDRAGLGLRYEGNIGKRVKGDAGVAFGYDIEGVSTSRGNTDQFAFLRLPIGLTVSVLQSKNFDAGLRVAYAFDISGNGKTGTATGRAFLGPVATIKW